MFLNEHAKLRRTGNMLSKGTTEKRKRRSVIYNNCIFGCFNTRLCKLVILYPYGIVINLIRYSHSLFQEIVSSQERKTLPY